MTNYTDFELKFINNMLDNDYGNAPQHCIYSWAWSHGGHGEFCTESQISGVVSSLVKKGIVKTDGEDEEHYIELTTKGMQTIIDLDLAQNAYDRRSYEDEIENRVGA